MKTLKSKSNNDAGRMIQTLCLLFLGIHLTNYTTGDFSGQSTMLMIVVTVVILASTFFITVQQKSNVE